MRLTIGLLAAALWFALPITSEAKTLRWANDGDVSSMDPYYFNESFLLSFMLNVYEPLVQRDKNLNLEPALATKWERTSPTVWRFTLRQGVKFHDGSSFSADDVLFSYKRASHESSDIKSKLASVAEARKIDDYTVEFITSIPNPLLPGEMAECAIMSKVWAEKNGAAEPSDARKKTENFAMRNANGTGPFMLKTREPDVRTVLTANPAWWDKAEHNLSEIIFTPIKSAATRVAALISGEIDMVYTVPLQDVERIDKTPGRKVLQGPELRTVFLGMDQARDRLEGSNIADGNPFKDVRVRQAIYQAIDIEAIKSRVMRGAARPTGLMIGAGVNGFDAGLNQRFAFDPQAAQKLLAEAGYPDGFEVPMNCPNDRYVNDEQICLAIAPMLKRIGITVKLTTETKTSYFQKILSRNASFYMLGWTPGTYDAHNALFNLMASPTPDGQGGYNLGGYSNARVDELTAAIRTEGDVDKRTAMIHEAFKIHKDEFGHVPLHQQALAWGVKSNIDLIQLPSNFFVWRWVRVN